MAERHADHAIYLSRTRDGLGQELGEWAEGRCDHGPWIACTDEQLGIAVRFLLLLWTIARKRAASQIVDAAAAVDQIERIRTALIRVKTINTKATAVRSSADEIQAEAESLRYEVRDALSDLEVALSLRATSGTGSTG
jgi:hypothetical protein